MSSCHTIVCLATAIALLPGVIAGNRAWEAPLRHLAPPERIQIAVDVAGHAAVNSSTKARLQERFLSFVPQSGPGTGKVWPDSTISYCFETTEARDKLLEHFELAVELWRSGGEDGQGLKRDKYKYVEAFDPGSSCVKNSQRDRVLVISYNSDGRLSTTVGMPSLDANAPEYKGPTMALSDKADIGMLDVVANYAHEIGHAWGLYHEHQNINYWGGDYRPGSLADPGSAIFGEKFDCTALKDYETALAAVMAKNPSDKDLLCKFRGVASQYQFSAADWLPISSPTQMHQGAGGDIMSQPSYDNVDWKSIMMYPSGAGGKGSAVAPGGDADKRADVLLRNDGGRMGINLVPSELDIKGVRTLYENKLDDQFIGMPVLPNSKGSKWASKFKNTFKKTKKNC